MQIWFSYTNSRVFKKELEIESGYPAGHGVESIMICPKTRRLVYNRLIVTMVFVQILNGCLNWYQNMWYYPDQVIYTPTHAPSLIPNMHWFTQFHPQVGLKWTHGAMFSWLLTSYASGVKCGEPCNRLRVLRENCRIWAYISSIYHWNLTLCLRLIHFEWLWLHWLSQLVYVATYLELRNVITNWS